MKNPDHQTEKSVERPESWEHCWHAGCRRRPTEKREHSSYCRQHARIYDADQGRAKQSLISDIDDAIYEAENQGIDGLVSVSALERAKAEIESLRRLVGAKTETQSNDNRHPPIPVPRGGFISNADEARWLESTLIMRVEETLRKCGFQNATIQPTNLYDLLLDSLNTASIRGAQRAKSGRSAHD